MSLLKRFVAFSLVVVLLFSMVPAALAKPAAEPDSTSFDAEAHDALAALKQMSTMALRPASQVIENDYVEFYVSKEGAEWPGRFTIGNAEGNPNYSSDNNKILMFGHPNPWSSYTTIRINDSNYLFYAENTLYDSEALTAVSTMTVEDVLITQTLKIVENSGSGVADTVNIRYTVENRSGVSKNIGVRIMLDTMLGNNDGAPFKIPSLGNVLTEKELTGNSIPQFWQAFDDLDDPSVFAVGTFYKAGERKPDKVQFTAWRDIYDADAAWSYTVTPGKAVTGDSAVAAYWNPVPVSPNSSTTVSTYYGVGFTSDPSDVSAEVNVPSNGFCIQIVDENGQPVDGVTVDLLNSSPMQTKTTESNGAAIFSGVPTNVFGADGAKLRISKDGYQTLVVQRAVSGGIFTSATIYQDDGKAHVMSANATIDNTTTDLLNYYKYFKEDADDTTAAQDKTNVKDLQIEVVSSGPAQISKYQIIQDGHVVFESNTNTITIPVYTGTPTEPNKYASNWRIDSLKAGKDVYIRVVDTNGAASEKKRIGICVSKPTTYGMSDTEGTLEFGREVKVTVPSDIPIVGNTEIELGWNGLPFKMDISQDGKVKIAINPEIDFLTGEVDWGNAKKDFNDKQLQAINNRLDKTKTFGGKPQSFGAGKLEAKANILGYGEGFVDENGNFSVDIGLVITVWEKGEYTWTFFLGYVPVYVAVGEKFELAVSGQLNLTSSNGRIKVTGLDGALNPSFTLNVDGGVGANGVLNIGASGRAKISWLSYFANNYQRVDLTGSVHVVAQAFLFKAEKKLAEGTWTLYEAGVRRAPSLYAAVRNADFYDASSYTPIDRSYLDAPRPYFLDSETVKYAVYPDASPVLVQVEDTSYLFWLEDIASRESNDRTALVYATSTDGSNWSDPVPIFAEDASGTADFAFDVFVDGTDVHIAISKAADKFGDGDVTIEDLAQSSEIYYAKLNTSTSSVITKRITSNRYADTMPKILSHNGEVVVAYSTNQMEAGFFGSDSTHSLSLTHIDDLTTKVLNIDGLVTDIALGTLNGSVEVAFVLDTDSDYSTGEDTELWIWNGIQNTRFRTGEAGVSTPEFLKTSQHEALLWYENNNICFSENASSVSKLFETAPYNLSTNFSIITGNGNPQIVWTASSDDEYTTTTSVYATSYMNNQWTPVYKLFDSDSEFTTTISGYSDGGKTYIAHLDTYADYETQVSSLCVSAITPDVDIELEHVDYRQSDVNPGEELPLSITVANKGSKPIDTLEVTVSTDYEILKRITLENIQLGCGETKTFSLASFIVPQWLDGAEAFDIEICYEDDECYAWSQQSITLGYTDLELHSEKLLIDESDYANIIVKNVSNIPTDAILRISSDEKGGAVLFEKRLTNITKENVVSTLVNLTQLSGGTDIPCFYVQVISSVEELLQLDNSQFINVNLHRQKKYALTVIAGEGGTVVGDIGGKFAPGEEITITAIPNDSAWLFSGWRADPAVAFSDLAAGTVTFVMPEHNVTVYADFEDVSIDLSLSHSGISLYQHQTFQLQYSLDPQEDLADTLYWTSSDPSVATVDANGLVTASGAGSTTITLQSTHPRIRPAVCRVVVTGVVSVNDGLELESEHNYANYSHTIWHYSQPGAALLRFTFSDNTEFESGYDFLSIYDSTFSLIGSYSGTELSGATVEIPDSQVFLILESDQSVTRWGFKVVDCSFACLQHSYDNVLDATCNVCGELRHITHTGWFKDNEKWYYYENGVMVVKKWRKDSVGWVYLGADGAMVTNAWCTDSQGWCYVDANGYAVTNCWKKDSIGWIWLNANGSMTKNTWLNHGGKWYFLNEGGYMVTNKWMKDSRGWVFVGQDGAMVTNRWVKDSKGWCYVGSDGYAVTNQWKRDSIGWIYLDANGSMTKAKWIQSGGNWYYCDANGYMVTGQQRIGGKWYTFNAGGVWIG